jgi:coenzyme F420-0:L-glutamate ligase/coenzyme F420-1:gamma-L-glutamate ligase
MHLSLKDQLVQTTLSRRSVRRFTGSEVPNAVIDRVLLSAIWAPSAHNAQPWRFVIVRKGETRSRLVEEMNKLFQIDLVTDGLSVDKARETVRRTKETILSSPVLLLVCLTMEDMRHYKDERRSEAEYLMAVQSVSAAIQNLLLVAYLEGLGTCWMCTPLFCREIVKTILNLPEEFDPQAFVVMGYPDEKPDPPKRKPIEQVVLWK